MEFKIGQKKIQLEQGDITQQDTEAIVNAANPTLLGGGGVDGAIHRMAGPKLLEECRALPQIQPGVRCKPGTAVITKGYELRAPWVIHTVGPIYRDGKGGEPEILRQAYQSCLDLACQKKLKSIAFPSISTGAYGYPLVDAAHIAADTFTLYFEENPTCSLELIKMVLFTISDLERYQMVFQKIITEKGNSLQ